MIFQHSLLDRRKNSIFSLGWKIPWDLPGSFSNKPEVFKPLLSHSWVYIITVDRAIE